MSVLTDIFGGAFKGAKVASPFIGKGIGYAAGYAWRPALGYGVHLGTNALADKLDETGSAGSLWTGLLRAGGSMAGAEIGIGGTVRKLGKNIKKSGLGAMTRGANEWSSVYRAEMDSANSARPGRKLKPINAAEEAEAVLAGRRASASGRPKRLMDATRSESRAGRGINTILDNPPVDMPLKQKYRRAGSSTSPHRSGTKISSSTIEDGMLNDAISYGDRAKRSRKSKRDRTASRDFRQGRQEYINNRPLRIAEKVKANARAVEAQMNAVRAGDISLARQWGIGGTKRYSAGSFMENFSTTRYIGKAALFTAKEMGNAVTGIARSPFVMAKDVYDTTRSATSASVRAGKTLLSFADDGYNGARAFGWGAAIGAGSAAMSNTFGFQQDPMIGAGSQSWDPARGGKSRRVNDNLQRSTQGLVQAMHLNR